MTLENEKKVLENIKVYSEFYLAKYENSYEVKKLKLFYFIF